MPTFVADEVVTATKLNAGTARDWADWVPTYANLTIGGGTVVARYCQIGSELVVARFEFTFGSGSAVGSGPTISMPATAASTGYASPLTPLGVCNLIEAGVQTISGSVHWNSTTTFSPRGRNASGVDTGITATSPFTWGTGDKITFLATYEAA